MLCCLSACHLASLQKPGTGTTTVQRGRASVLDGVLTANAQRPPSKTSGGESSTAEQAVHWESEGELGHSTLFLSLTSSACVSLIISSSLSGSSPGNRTQTGTWCWQQVVDTPRFSAVYLSAVNTAASVVCSHLLNFRNSVTCILT